MIFLETGNQFLGTERVSKLMRQYAIPCIISLLVGALYNIVDQIFIANASYLGSYGNAANTVVFPLTVVALAIAVMLGDGCCAFVSMALGRNEVDKAKRSVGNAVVLSVVSSLVLTAVYLIFANTIIAMFGGTVNEETFRHSQEYFFYITLGIPFYMFGQAMNPIIRADGNPKFAMISTLAGAAINIYNQCAIISPSEAKPGDIIFFTGTYDSPGPVSHVGIYVGDGMMLHCGSPIQYANINSSYWQTYRAGTGGRLPLLFHPAARGHRNSPEAAG